MPVSLCLCTVIEIRRRTKSLDLVLCTVVYIVKPGGAIGLGKTSITIWTISSLENWGNHWGKWTILRSFRTTWVTLHDCIGGVTWQHIPLNGKDQDQQVWLLAKLNSFDSAQSSKLNTAILSILLQVWYLPIWGSWKYIYMYRAA